MIWLQVPAAASLATACGFRGPVAAGVMLAFAALAAATAAARRPTAATAIVAGGFAVALAAAAQAAAFAPAGRVLGAGTFAAIDALAFIAVVGRIAAASMRATERERLDAAVEAKLSEITRLRADRETPVTDDTDDRSGHLAHHDEITGLPSRVLMMERLAEALESERELVILYLDLSDLKLVNESTGHASGDRALAIIATRIRRCIRTGDTASRVGGDEFVVICSVTDAAVEGVAIAERLIAAVSEPIHAGSARMHLGANIGISVAPGDGHDPDDLIRKAEAAMYRAKESGANAFHLYEPAIHAEMLEKSRLRRDLEAAVANDEFIVYYQPIISMTSGAIIGAEALARWMHPTRGLLEPAEFVGVAEQYGLIDRIGESVMRKACAQIKRFALRTSDEFTMAVNVSALQFRKPAFVDTVRALLAHHVIDSARLEIEITESVIMDNMKSVLGALRELESLGVRLSIDDFGTGYSSLAYVKNFPVHTLKIDRSFVHDLAESPTDQAIAATIITLAHNLGMRVVAEGIETEEQFESVRRLGADDMQGYLISRPLPADDFERFVCARGKLRLAA